MMGKKGGFYKVSFLHSYLTKGNDNSSLSKESCSARDLGSIPGLGRSPAEVKGYPLQYSGLENSMDSHSKSMRSQRVRHN